MNSLITILSICYVPVAAPLSDLVVLELASVLAGPSAGQFFAELGATVVKVESPQGDVTRRWKLPGEPSEDTRSAYFAACNWGKQSVAIDLRKTAGRDLVQQLAAQSDVVLTSYKPGDAAKLGVDAATLRAQHPRLIYVELTGYGADDPRAGYDAVIQAESGFTYMNGQPGGPPTKMPVALMDVLAAHQIKEAVLLALLQRATTGEGATLQVSLLQAAVSGLVNQATNWLVGGVVPQRKGSDHPNIVPYGTVFTTADGQEIVLAVGTDRQFAALCDVLELSVLRSDQRFATNTVRVQHREDLLPLLANSIATRTRADLLADLQRRHVPAGAVNAMPQVFEQAAAQAQVLRASDNPATAGIRQVAFSHAAETPSPPPHFAADTASVLRDRLGMGDDAIRALASDGVIHLG